MEDAAAICELINYYAERGRMLHRSLESVYGSLREFVVAEDDDGTVVGCSAMHIFWSDLAEVKSLAVDAGFARRGIGRELLMCSIRDARQIGAGRLFTLTYETEFFAACGFTPIDRSMLPEKVWRECVQCPKADACDEIAMILPLKRRDGEY